MQFENYTPFPAMAWSNIDKNNQVYTTVVVRVKYCFDVMDESGLWSLKLDQNQGELFEEDIFYEDNMYASVLYELDYIPYKPHADLVINGYAHEQEPKREWLCGVEVLRHKKDGIKKLLEQHVRVYGERDWHWWLHGWNIYKAQKTKKVALRYENAYGGYSYNPKWVEDKENELKYLDYYKANPIGKGIIHRKTRKGLGDFLAHQIESIDEKITKINGNYQPQGFGFIHRSWEPRLSLVGSIEQEDITLLPKDFDETYYNGAHENLQLKGKGYFQPGDTIILDKMLKGESIQGVMVPAFYFQVNSYLAQKYNGIVEH